MARTCDSTAGGAAHPIGHDSFPGPPRRPACTPARLLIAAAACFVLGGVFLFGLIGVTGGIALVAIPASILGRVLAIASVVLIMELARGPQARLHPLNRDP
jgi:hypothetical protein